MDKPVKLNLGCGHRKIYGYINVDCRDEVEPDLQDNIFELNKIKNNSISVIYNSHVIEHCPRHKIQSVLQRWYDVLIPGGIIKIATPDIEKACAYYLLCKDLRQLYSTFWGDQQFTENNHLHGFDEKTLTEDLEKIGFVNVKKWDWQEDKDTFFIDDYSKAYLGTQLRSYSHGKAKIEGIHFSLNMCGEKSKNA